MSITVSGLKAKDEKFNKMLEIYRQCEELKIEAPKEVYEFFENVKYECVIQHHKNGMVVELEDCAKKDNTDHEDLLIVELAKIPKDVTHLRFAVTY